MFDFFTGLAPVSAIVSRVTSPAPGQVTSAPVKKSVSVPMVVSKLHSEESEYRFVVAFRFHIIEISGALKLELLFYH